MRAFVVGATGHTGAQLIDLALARGDSVTAFVRSPAKIHRTDPQLSVVRGDPHDVDALAAAMGGHDAVFSARPFIACLPPSWWPTVFVQERNGGPVHGVATVDLHR